MRAVLNDKNICNDKWLSALVDAMDEVEAERAEDICRGCVCACRPDGPAVRPHGQPRDAYLRPVLSSPDLPNCRQISDASRENPANDPAAVTTTPSGITGRLLVISTR